MKTRVLMSLLCFLLLFSGISYAQHEARVLRFPTVYNDQIVFTYAGDLYTVPSSGGMARKLTSHKGFEVFSRFSPDGKYIAFTGEYDGNREVYDFQFTAIRNQDISGFDITVYEALLVDIG